MSKGKNSYSATKGNFIQQRMNEGKTNDSARREWNRDHDLNFISGKGGPSPDEVRGNVDRTYESPSQDLAETSEDF